MNSYCNNCGKTGHLFHQCKSPIISYGIVAFRENPTKNYEREYLLIRRKDTLGFVDFMRGKYSVYTKEYILNMIKQMTNDEKHRLMSEQFSKLWDDLWGSQNASLRNIDPYKAEEICSKNKFESLRTGIYTKTEFYNLEDLINSTDQNWTEAEWGFPKGRRNYQERDYDCAVREFCEETGYSLNNLIPIKNIQPFEEIFTGSNYKSYKHKYYVTYMKYSDTLSSRRLQTSEVSDSEWMPIAKCRDSIRHYNIEKHRLILAVENMLNTNCLSQICT